MLGVEVQETATYWADMQPDGTLYGEGNGILMGKNGEFASYKGTGVIRLTSSGGASIRGVLYYQTASPGWAKLNGAVIVFEHEAEGDGKTRTQGWEWK